MFSTENKLRPRSFRLKTVHVLYNFYLSKNGSIWRTPHKGLDNKVNIVESSSAVNISKNWIHCSRNLSCKMAKERGHFHAHLFSCFKPLKLAKKKKCCSIPWRQISIQPMCFIAKSLNFVEKYLKEENGSVAFPTQSAGFSICWKSDQE